MIYELNDYGYGTAWKQVYVHSREGYFSSVVDFHVHEYYEINLVLSGNIRMLLPDHAEETTGCRIILTRPGTPHFISCQPDTLYSRLYLLFSHEFIDHYVPEWKQLLSVFGKNGRIIAITPEQKELCAGLIRQLQNETDLFRQRLITLYLLSHLAEFSKTDNTNLSEIPSYVTNAMTYISRHYAEKIIASDLAWQLNIGRTTLMTAFKKYTGSTVNEYLTHCRLQNTVRLLREGKTEQEVAELCGFCDSSGLIRSFRRNFGVSPKKYLLQLSDPDTVIAPQKKGSTQT